MWSFRRSDKVVLGLLVCNIINFCPHPCFLFWAGFLVKDLDLPLAFKNISSFLSMFVQLLFVPLLFFPFQSVNKAMQKKIDELTIGVLDIYGFEIFQVQYS